MQWQLTISITVRRDFLFNVRTVSSQGVGNAANGAAVQSGDQHHPGAFKRCIRALALPGGSRHDDLRL